MKTTTYWAYLILSLGALFIVLLQLDKLGGMYWKLLESIWLLLFIFLAAILYLAGTRQTSGGYLAMLLFGLNMLNTLVLYFLTGWLSMLILGAVVNLLGFVVGVEALQQTKPRVEPYHEEELLYEPPVPEKKVATKQKSARKRRKKAKRKE